LIFFDCCTRLIEGGQLPPDKLWSVSKRSRAIAVASSYRRISGAAAAASIESIEPQCRRRHGAVIF
jgi:hypothetical protein